jgi:hypothetical protein
MATDNRFDLFQKDIITFLANMFSEYSIKFVMNPRHIFEARLPKFGNDDLLLWHPGVAGRNLELVREYNSVVVLAHQTILIQKVSDKNPINENLALNNNFKVVYIDEEYEDITNADWKLAVSEDDYRFTQEQLQNFIIDRNYGTKRKI